MLSMPRGTDPLTVQWAAREFAKAELADHKLVMVLHDQQANPHVHISVRAESEAWQAAEPAQDRSAPLARTFAEKLRERGVEAEATRQAARGAARNHPALWRVKAAEDGRLLKPRSSHRRSAAVSASRAEARRAGRRSPPRWRSRRRWRPQAGRGHRSLQPRHRAVQRTPAHGSRTRPIARAGAR